MQDGYGAAHQRVREMVAELAEDPEFGARLKEVCAALEAQNAKFEELHDRLVWLRLKKT